MARRQSVITKIADTIEELAITLEMLNSEYPAYSYDIEIRRMSPTGVKEWWYIEVWKF